MRFFRNLFRSEPPSDNNREQGAAVNRNRLEQTAAGDTVLEEYTDGSQSYSYSETEEDVRPSATSKPTNVTLPVPDWTNSNSGRRERQSLPITAVPPPRSATAVAPEIRPDAAQHALPSFSRAPTRTNGSASSPAVRGVTGGEGSESSQYNLRPRQARGLAPARNSILKGGNAQATMSAGSVSQRDTKRASSKPVEDALTKPPDPLALSAMPHAASARTTSGVLGNPGKVSIADVNRATLSTLRYLCGELGIPATGSKLEVKERVMNKIKGEPYDGEEVQPLSPPGKAGRKGRVDDTGAAQSTPASSARRETITTTAGTLRVEGSAPPRNSLVGGIAAMSSKPSSSAAEVPTSNNPGSTAELSSTALSKFDSAAGKQQELRGTDPGLPSAYKDKADSETNSKRSPNDQDPRLVRTQRAGTSGLPSGGGSAAMHGHPSNAQTPSRRGGRPPTAQHNTPGRNERVNMPSSGMAVGDRRRSSLQANASEVREMMRRGSDLVPENARENRDRDRPSTTTPATATHLDGIRLTSANRNSRRVVDVPPGIDRMSPAGRSLPAVFSGAEGGPPNPTVSANEPASTTPRNQRTVGQRDTPAATATDAPAINAQVTPRVSQAPVPALAPLKPIPKRGSTNGFVTPGDIVRTFNRYTPRRRPSSSTMEPGGTNSQPSSLFQQGSRPSSERFPSNNVHRIRSSAFGVSLTPFSQQVNKRQSLRAFPLPSSQPSPISGGFNRKRHSTGMNSTPFNGRAGLLNDLRPALRASENDRRTPITSLNDIRARERWRRDDKGIAMASSAKKILAAIRKTGEENRVLCRGRKPLVPLGAPPSLKRARDEEDTGHPAGKRSRTGGFDSNARAGFTPTAKKDSSTPARQVCGLSPRIPYGKRSSRTFGSSDATIPVTPTKDAVSTPQTTEKRGRSSLLARTESIMGSVDRKRRLGTSQSDVKKRASKRRSLSSAVFDAIKDEVNAREKEIEGEEARKAKAKRGVTFAEPVDAVKPQVSEKETPDFAGKGTIETTAATETPFSLDKTVFRSPAPVQESKEFSFNVREDRVSEPPKDVAEPSNATITVPTPAPVVPPAAPEPAPVSLPDDKTSSVRVSDGASKNVESEAEPKISFGTAAFVKSQTRVSFGHPALADDPKPLPSVSAPSATSPGPGEIVASVKPENDDPKTAKKSDVSETATEKPDTTEVDKPPATFTPKINPVTGGPSYSASPGPTDAGASAVAASAAADSSSGAFGSTPKPTATFGTSSVSFAAPSTAEPSTFGLPAPSAPSSAATPSAARKLPFGTNAPSTAGVFGSKTTSEKDTGSSSMALKASSSFLSSSSAAQSGIPIDAPSSTSAPSFGMSSAAAAAPSTEFGGSSATASSGGFGASSTPSFGFSAPSFATNSTPFGASSSAFAAAAPSSPFGTSTSDPFGASKSEAEKSQTPFGAGSTTFGTTSAGFGSSSTPFGQSSGGNAFSAFGASAKPSGNPFAAFTTSTPGTGSGAVPFGNFPSSFNPSSAAATAPFDFSATTPATSSNQPSSTPFGGSAPNPFGGNPSGGFGSSNTNSFGNPMSNASPSPFEASTGSNPFGQPTPSFGAQLQSNTAGFGGFGQPSGGFGQSQPSAPFGGFGQSAQGAFGQPQQQQSLSSEAQNLFGGASQPSSGHFTMGGAAPRPSGQARGRRILRARRSRR